VVNNGTPFQPFKPVGFDGTLLQFVTKSWTGGIDEYEVCFALDKMDVCCSCMDASCRSKNHRQIGDAGLCKHARLASQLLWPIIARSLRLSGEPSLSPVATRSKEGQNK